MQMLTALVLAVLAAVPLGAQGHRITGNQVVVNGLNQWQNWEFVPTTLQFTEDGGVRPHRLFRATNATADILDYLQLRPPAALEKEPDEVVLLDAIQAGSNRRGVLNVLDGDLATYWEPDFLDPEKPVNTEWWFSVDLGRHVLADRIVLKFVEEGQGDPLLLFDVLVSDGRRPGAFPLAPNPEFRPVERVFTPNKSQREFVIELPSDDEAPGQGIRFVQLIATGTDSTRGAEVSQEEYQRLLAESPEDAGAVEYFRRQADGRQILVDQSVYDALDPERRGDVVFFRRERPRLAELEVWHQGDEILMETDLRGGSVVTSEANAIAGIVADGDGVAQTLVQEIGPSPPLAPEGFFQWDLGSFYWVDRQMILYPQNPRRNKLNDYRLEFSDGSRNAEGNLRWEVAVARSENPSFVIGHEFSEFDPVKARFFRFNFLRVIQKRSGSASVLSEIHLYGEGYQPQVELESDLVRLGGSRNLLSIEWEADAPPGTQVVMQTRTGNELDVIRTYFKQLNPALPKTVVSEEEYNSMREAWKAGFTEEERLGSDWSDWSEPYRDPAGSPITSPSPREFVKIRAILLSDDPQASATLRSLRLNFANPVAQQLFGEVFPFQVDSLGVERQLSLYVRPEFGAQDPGFDQLLLTGPADMDFALAGIYGGSQDDFGNAGDLAPLALEGVEVVASGSDSLILSFPTVRRNSGLEVLRLDFNTTLFSGGALLRGRCKIPPVAAVGNAWTPATRSPIWRAIPSPWSGGRSGGRSLTISGCWAGFAPPMATALTTRPSLPSVS